MVPELDHRLWFPDPWRAVQGSEYAGLVAWGGDLTVPRLLLAYGSGIFPWTDEPVTWWSPDPRAILELDAVHVPRSLARALRRCEFTLTVNRAFRRVMEGCSRRSPWREETWISGAFIRAYTELHRQGHAHSVECWQGNRLVGGIYGVAVGGFFAGESMFHCVDNASKVALCHLVTHLRQQGFVLFDIQQTTAVTRLMGAITIPRDVYLRRLAEAVRLPRCFDEFRAEAAPDLCLRPG